MKRLLSLLCAFILSFTIIGATGCGEDDFSYTAIDPGTLKAAEAEFAPAEEDAVKNAAYREKYPTFKDASYKKYETPVKITVAAINYDLEPGIPAGTKPQNQSFNRIAKEVLNIDLSYTKVFSDSIYDQQIQLSITNDSLPDMFYTTQSELFTLLRDKNLLADLTDAYYSLNDNLLNNYKTYMPELITACMKDGKLYALPQQSNRFTAAQRLYVRKDWLEIAGVKAPTTIEEMISVGEAFLAHKAEIAEQTGIPVGNVIPFSMHKDITYAGSFGTEGMFNAHGASMGAFFKGDDGEIYCSNTSPEAKNAVETMREMYKKGILDSEFLSNSVAQVQSYVSAGYVGMVFGEWWLPKDALQNAVSSSMVKNADWTWVNLPKNGDKGGAPIVDTMMLSGYNLVSAKCKHPEAIAQLVNLFYDIYYNDNAIDAYGEDVLPSKGFFYQFVPVKVWDGMASAEEMKRVQSVFKNMYAGGLTDRNALKEGIKEVVSTTQSGDIIVSVDNNGTTIIKRSVLDTIKSLGLEEEFNKLRNREKILHFADGYPYYVAYREEEAKKAADPTNARNYGVKNMTKAEKDGWGIYHEMIDENGSYAYVVALAEDDEGEGYKVDKFYGTALSSMNRYGSRTTTLSSVDFTLMITDKKPMSDFDKYVKDYNKSGGNTILKQVKAWYRAMHQFEQE